MQRLRSLSVAAVAAATLAAAGGTLAAPQAGAPFTEARSDTDRVIVRFRDDAKRDNAALTAAVGAEATLVRRTEDGAHVVNLGDRLPEQAMQGLIARLAARSDVAFAEADAWMTTQATPTDPLWSSQWDMTVPAEGNYGANLPGAWDITTGSSAIVVGVIDTGLVAHADLAGRSVAGYDFVSTAAIGNDGDGRDADASDPGDWCGSTPSSWHGTHVAGTIGAAANNATGVAGINRVSKIQPIRALGACGGYLSDVADAIRWGAGLVVTGVPANPTRARVLNLSLGAYTGRACSTTMQSAITAAVGAGVVVVVAAGNSNADASKFEPANCTGVITVGATARSGAKASYSNVGSTVEISAPGGDAAVDTKVLSTVNTGTTSPVGGGDRYVAYQGTSMAAPHVAGVASLMLSVNPLLTPASVLATLQAQVTPFPAGSTCTTSLCGKGILNAQKAVNAVWTALSVPGVFAKKAPVNGATGVGSSPTLTWGASANAATYEVCVVSGQTAPTTWCATPTVVTTTSLVLSRLTVPQIWWQVRAVNVKGSAYANASTTLPTGIWWSFTTTPGAFSKSSPAANATGQLLAPTLQWASSATAVSYEVCVVPYSATPAWCASPRAVTGLSVVWSGLAVATKYTWQVRAVNAVGFTYANASTTSTTGTWWAFTTT